MLDDTHLLSLDEILHGAEGNVARLTRFSWHYVRRVQDGFGVGHSLNQHQPRVQKLSNLL